MTKSNAANMAAFRRRAKEQKLVRVEMYLHPQDADLIRHLAKQLKEKRNAAN